MSKAAATKLPDDRWANFNLRLLAFLLQYSSLVDLGTTQAVCKAWRLEAKTIDRLAVGLVAAPNDAAKLAALRGIVRRSQTSAAVRDRLFSEAKAFPAILQLCKPDTGLKLLQGATQAVADLCRTTPSPSIQLVRLITPLMLDA
jgi:hypothetical protein